MTGLEVGPLRDMLAKLSEASRTGSGLTVGDIATRVGWPYEVARRRLVGSLEGGYTTYEERTGRFHITDAGRELLNGRS